MELLQPKTFRDRPNIDSDGKKNWIYARKPKGKWYNRRAVTAWGLILFLIAAPFIKINGQPFMMLDIAGRKFHLFGTTIFAQDTFQLALVMAVTVVSVVLFTVVYGRLFCGWLCPQTIFLEFVYRQIEYLFDGNYRDGKKPHPDTLRTLAKHSTFIFVSILITNILLMWFIGPEGVWKLIQEPIRDNIAGFSIMVGISGFYYWIYAFFREQVCTMICPYGRMQSVLVDGKTMAVTYDYKRGEPRGSESDCINCKRCIAVCPTGIDIKNGNQLECINCTACIDECNIVMKRLGRAPNLIGYASAEDIENGRKSLFNFRTIAYTSVLFILLSVLAFTLARKAETEATLLRAPGTLSIATTDSTYSNVYNFKIINKTVFNKEIELRLNKPAQGVIKNGANLHVPAQKSFEGVVLIELHKKYLLHRSIPIEVAVLEKKEQVEVIEASFLSPAKTE